MFVHDVSTFPARLIVQLIILVRSSNRDPCFFMSQRLPLC